MSAKTCRKCGATFTAKGNRLYCEACSPTGSFTPYVPRPKKSTEKTCPCCGETFTDETHNQRKVYCSRACNDKNMQAIRKVQRAQRRAAALEREQAAAQKKRERPPVDMMRDYNGDTPTPCWTCHMLAYCRSILWDVSQQAHPSGVDIVITPLPCTEPGWTPLGPIMWAAEPAELELAEAQP